MDGSWESTEIVEVGAAEGYRLVEPLLQAHFEEIARFKDLFVIKPDLDRYADYETAGRLIGLVAKRAGVVVGYCASFLTYNLHYSDTLICQNDVLYVTPAYRKSTVGFRLMKNTIVLASARGAKLMMWHSKPETALHTLLPRHGYEVLDVVWAKRI